MNLKQRTIDVLKKTNLFDHHNPCNTGVMNAPLTVVSPKMILALRKSARQKLKFALLALVSKNLLYYYKTWICLFVCLQGRSCFVGVGEFQCTMTSIKFYQRIQAIVSCGQCFPRKESELFALPLDLNNAQCSMKINA